MTAKKLMAYASAEIDKYDLGPEGPLGETGIACGRVGTVAVRLYDGQGLDVLCRSKAAVDRELAVKLAWLREKWIHRADHS